MIIPFPENKAEAYDIAGLLSQLRNNRTFQCSPVAYLTELLEDYLNGSMDAGELCRKYAAEIRKAQFLFSHMPPSEIKNNKRIFQKEFHFADGLTAIIREEDPSEDVRFRNAILACLSGYLSQ